MRGRPLEADVAVVGAGQAGLATGHHLQGAGLDFVILEAADQVGSSWRQRWESLRLFTPAGFSSLPGDPFPAAVDQAPTRDEVVAYLESYATRLESRIEFGCRVHRAERRADRWVLDVGDQRWSVRAVVFAAGAHTRPVIPGFAAALPAGLTQFSSLEYRRPDQVPPGPVVVIGAANSGAEIAADLAKTHRVTLAGRDVGHVPSLGPWTYPLMQRLGRPGSALSRQLLGGRGDPLGRLRPGDLEAAGVTRTARVAAVDGEDLVLVDGRRLTGTTVIWATGLRPDARWLPAEAVTDLGTIRHHLGIADRCDRLYTVGMPYQRSVTSHLIGGVGADARRIVTRLTADLSSQHTRYGPFPARPTRERGTARR